jgi:hypothetical protein
MYVEAQQLEKRSATIWNDDIAHSVQWFDPVGAPVPYVLSSSDKIESTERRLYVGWDQKDFYRRRKKGELLPMTPWKQYECIGSSTGSYSFVTSAGSKYWYVGNFPCYEHWILTEEDMLEMAPSDYSEYLTEAAARIYSKGFDALTFMAEFASLKHQFTDLAKKLRHVNLPPPSSKTFKRDWKKFNSEWLSLRYGWRPLLYDITGINEAIKNFNKKKTRYSQYAGTKNTDVLHETPYNQWSYFKVQHVITTTVTVAVRGSVTADIEIPTFQFNPLQTGWEIIPFSFVLDWFLNVGNTLAAISFACREKRYTAAKSVYITAERVYEAYSYDFTPSFGSGDGFVQSGSSSASLKLRTPCRIPYHPSFVLKMNNLKVLDLMALIFQRLN